MLEHEKTLIHFSSKEKSYVVEYGYVNMAYRMVMMEKTRGVNNASGFCCISLQAFVYENGIMIKNFQQLPETKTQNPTKTHAKELITIALKEKKKNSV